MIQPGFFESIILAYHVLVVLILHCWEYPIGEYHHVSRVSIEADASYCGHHAYLWKVLAFHLEDLEAVVHVDESLFNVSP